MGKYVIRPEDRPLYSPAGHEGTTNRDLIGKDNTGAKYMEIVLGHVGGAVHAHSHEKMEQAIYIIKGSARVVVEGEVEEASAGDVIFFPSGKLHELAPIGAPYEALVIYAPPRGG